MATKNYYGKLYSAGIYKGVLPYIISDVEFTETINTAGCEITIKLGTDLRNAGITVDVDYLVTNTGDNLVDDNGSLLIARKDYKFSTVPVDLGNQIDIWLQYSSSPNGTRIFTGIVTSWEADESDGTITMTALSYGVQLDNYLIEVSPNNNILDYSTYTTTDLLYADSSASGGPFNRITSIAQTFTVLSPTTIQSVSLSVSNNAVYAYSAKVELYSGIPGTLSTLLGTASRSISNSSQQLVTFTFSSPPAVTTGVTYSIRLTYNAGVDYSLQVGRDAGGSYAGGDAYSYNESTATWTIGTGDYSFVVTTATGALGNQYNSYDPGDIIVSLLDNFTNAGGVVNCDTTSVWSTGTAVSYTFKYNTVLEGIQKCLELAPPNWYWYVDVGSNILYFKSYSLFTINHTFIKGEHIEDMKVKYSLEPVKNKVIYSGGENPATPGINVISSKSNTSSISKYGQWLSMDSDSRVTLQSTADILASNMLGEGALPIFTATVTILASRYNIETIKPGNMAAFRNFNDLTNDLILLVSSVKRQPDHAVVTFATLPPTQIHRIEDIKRNLDALVTADNPAQ